MKIVFLCGSLEPGHDGVGDYTSKLAVELISRGHQVAAVALNDPFIANIVEEKHGKDTDLTILRLPSQLNNGEKYSLAKQWIQQYNPEWISLQFVIYAYNPKGLPFGLAKLIKSLGLVDTKWHIMFHEIWIGINKSSSLKKRIIGYFQKRIIRSVFKALQPKLVTTSNILYRLVLNSIGIDAVMLSLFSNIDVGPQNEKFTDEVLSKIGLSDKSELSRWELTGAFGQFHPDVDLEDILKKQLTVSKARGLQMAFIAFGRIGDRGLSEFERLEKILLPDIKFIYLGEQSRENVSAVLQLLNTGICFTRWQYVGKSGVYAAMKLHGINVIVPEDEKIPRYDDKIKQYQEEIKSRLSDDWSVLNVSENLLTLLAK